MGGGGGRLVKMVFRPKLVSFATYSYYKIIRITKSNESQAHANISKTVTDMAAGCIRWQV